MLWTIYFAYFPSCLKYGIIFWGGDTESKMAYGVQKRVIQIISGPNKCKSCRLIFQEYRILTVTSLYISQVQCDSFGTRPKKMRISLRLFIRFWTCIYDYIPCFMRSMSILEEMLEMFATTVQAELNATLHVCESGLQDVLTNRSNFMSNVVFQWQT